MNSKDLLFKQITNEKKQNKRSYNDSDFYSNPTSILLIGDTSKDERRNLQKFVAAYRDLPVLWDVKSLDYTKKDKRNDAYEILLKAFRSIKYDGTVEDVKKKINSMRSNFRKELKKVSESTSLGMNYRPTSWMYEELMFLKDLETPHARRKSCPVSDDNDMTPNQDTSRVLHNEKYTTYPLFPRNKKPRFSEVKQNKSMQSPLFRSPESIFENQCDIAKVWSSKLKYLDHMQRLFAEKAINDVLFEAQLGTLHRNSVSINEGAEAYTVNSSSIRKVVYDQRIEPSQSSPEYKYSETDEFRSDDN